jgi:hypothetical protein
MTDNEFTHIMTESYASDPILIEHIHQAYSFIFENVESDALQSDTTLTMYHGVSNHLLNDILTNGIDATKEMPRYYNQGRERGLYVTPNKKIARGFGSVVLEFDVKGKDLYPTARWGLGVSRKSKLTKEIASEKYPNSFRPVVSMQLNETTEPQAMFIGYLPVSSIKAIHMDNGSFTVDEYINSTSDIDESFDWNLDWSADEIIKYLANKYDASISDIVSAIDTDFDYFTERMPRKIRMRLKEYKMNAVAG